MVTCEDENEDDPIVKRVLFLAEFSELKDSQFLNKEAAKFVFSKLNEEDCLKSNKEDFLSFSDLDTLYPKAQIQKGKYNFIGAHTKELGSTVCFKVGEENDRIKKKICSSGITSEMDFTDEDINPFEIPTFQNIINHSTNNNTESEENRNSPEFLGVVNKRIIFTLSTKNSIN